MLQYDESIITVEECSELLAEAYSYRNVGNGLRAAVSTMARRAFPSQGALISKWVQQESLCYNDEEVFLLTALMVLSCS